VAVEPARLFEAARDRIDGAGRFAGGFGDREAVELFAGHQERFENVERGRRDAKWGPHTPGSINAVEAFGMERGNPQVKFGRGELICCWCRDPGLSVPSGRAVGEFVPLSAAASPRQSFLKA
jgi:hypothetical protein